jgi:hypothetical protein
MRGSFPSGNFPRVLSLFAFLAFSVSFGEGFLWQMTFSSYLAMFTGPFSGILMSFLVKLNGRDLECVCNGATPALAKAGVFSPQITGSAEGTE